MTKKPSTHTENVPRKPRDERDAEIVEIQNGLPLVLGYWDFVAKEVEELRRSDEEMVAKELEQLKVVDVE